MPIHARIGRAALLGACLVLALILARRLRDARPVAIVFGALACLDVARLAPLPAWADVAAWVAWPGMVASLAWRVWRGRGWPIALAFTAYAVAVLLAPRGWWPAHAWLWIWARRAPYWTSPALCLVAWALKDEGPSASPPRPSPASGSVVPLPVASNLLHHERGPASTDAAGSGLPSRVHPTGPTTPAQHAPSRVPVQVASVLAISGALDVAVGALADDAVPWWVAWVTSGATWAIVCGIMVRWVIRSRASSRT